MDRDTARVSTFLIPRPIDAFSLYPQLQRYQSMEDPNICGLKELRVLVVGGNSMTTVCANYLKELGFNATVKVSTSSEALLAISDESPTSKFDMVVTHYTLPDTSGLHLAETISRLDIEPRLPVVLIMNAPVSTTLAEKAASSVFDWIEPPITIQVALMC